MNEYSVNVIHSEISGKYTDYPRHCQRMLRHYRFVGKLTQIN